MRLLSYLYKQTYSSINLGEGGGGGSQAVTLQKGTMNNSSSSLSGQKQPAGTWGSTAKALAKAPSNLLLSPNVKFSRLRKK